ncbi:Down syndrome cell adhesion molecule protein Dscam2-like [Tropilaelaps mercedesae]|uniref:Down syndrome cell adhesion molecule protein Dscam2-like n=1 Tax=Tropilaelaps mercedesae TaxID=418985 RepID=A0A1V9XBI4_9ACAR|nr:Down syndrome cell adhesion molecule protein Dscam2-like [Tropilaelaps mercedesae]
MQAQVETPGKARSGEGHASLKEAAFDKQVVNMKQQPRMLYWPPLDDVERSGVSHDGRDLGELRNDNGAWVLTIRGTGFQLCGGRALNEKDPSISPVEEANVVTSMYPVERGPTFVLEPPSSMEFSSDTGAVVPCSAQGQPSPQVRWEKRDGSPAGPIAGVRDIRPDGSLLFHQFSVAQFRPDVHATAYRCVAYNHVGLIKSRLVQIKGGPTLRRTTDQPIVRVD